MLLELLGRRLLRENATVYHIENAGYLNDYDRSTWVDLYKHVKQTQQKTVLLIDEVHQNFAAPAWTNLLRDPEGDMNFVVMGFGVKRSFEPSPSFQDKLSSSELFLVEGTPYVSIFYLYAAADCSCAYF